VPKYESGDYIKVEFPDEVTGLHLFEQRFEIRGQGS
jgi:hypothetical protein